MWPFLSSIKLIRYLLVWKINSPIVRVPRYPAGELSQTLGRILAGRLPAREARAWRKASSLWREKQEGTPSGDPFRIRAAVEAPWPIEAVLLVYPGKLVYGKGEPFLWELKLFGENADHEFFLEVVLPAMEEAGYTSELSRKGSASLWGHFDIDAVYVAKGMAWEPLVRSGKLDLRVRPSAVQWCEKMDWGETAVRPFTILEWPVPFDLEGWSRRGAKTGRKQRREILSVVMEELLIRMGRLMGTGNADELWSPEEQAYLQRAMELARRTPVRSEKLQSVPRRWPGRWKGRHTFASIPSDLVPYLQLASILHIGRQTHWGCGTFVLH